MKKILFAAVFISSVLLTSECMFAMQICQCEAPLRETHWDTYMALCSFARSGEVDDIVGIMNHLGSVIDSETVGKVLKNAVFGGHFDIVEEIIRNKAIKIKISAYAVICALAEAFNEHKEEFVPILLNLDLVPRENLEHMMKQFEMSIQMRDLFTQAIQRKIQAS